MPNVVGNRSTQNQIFAYALLLAPVGVLPWLMGFAGLAYGIVSIAAGAAFVWFAFRCWRMPSNDKAMVPAKRLFAFSIVYLFVLFGTLILEAALPGLAALLG